MFVCYNIKIKKYLQLTVLYDNIKKAQNTHAIGVCRRVQVKLMEAYDEGSRGHNKNKMEELKKCLNQ